MAKLPHQKFTSTHSHSATASVYCDEVAKRRSRQDETEVKKIRNSSAHRIPRSWKHLSLCRIAFVDGADQKKKRWGERFSEGSSFLPGLVQYLQQLSSFNSHTVRLLARELFGYGGWWGKWGEGWDGCEGKLK